MRIVEIGAEAINAKLWIKNNARNKFSLTFWDDVAKTIPSTLTGATIIIELVESSVLTTVWTATIVGNVATFDQAASTAQFTWESRPFHVVLTKTAIPTLREVVMTGEAEIQR